MQQLYLVRHGDADYELDCLTPIGIQQVNKLGQKLENRLPIDAGYVIVSSPSGRTLQTATTLRPYLRKKSKSDIELCEDSVLGESQHFVLLTQKSIERGQGILRMVSQYLGGDIVVVTTTHKGLIGATSYVIAMHYGIVLPPDLIVREEIDDVLVGFIMESENVVKEEAIMRIMERGRVDKILPEVGKANAVFFDLDHRIAELIRPD